MTASNHYYAVLTGDLVKSSKLKREAYAHLQSLLKRTFEELPSLCKEARNRQHTSEKSQNITFDIYRGDSFQGLLPWPETSLTTTLYIRAALRSEQPDSVDTSSDARIAIGIGSVDHLPEDMSEKDGDAFRRSGPKLDNMKSTDRLIITTPWDDINREMAAQSALLDTVVTRWTPEQAQTVMMLLSGMSRKEIGDRLGISQTAVYYRVRGSGWPAIKKLLERYKEVIYRKSKSPL